MAFSWNRILGVTKAKQKIARATGIPTTKAGRKKKVRRIVTGSEKKGFIASLLGL